MKITFLGTSAGESYPAVWCDCENCTYARAHGGRNLRMNTGTMIDSDTLLDMNSCGFYTAASCRQASGSIVRWSGCGWVTSRFRTPVRLTPSRAAV